MELKNYNIYFFFLLLIIVSVLAFLIVKPFLIAIFIAAILAIVFRSPYKFFLNKTGDRRKLSAFLTSILAFLVFVIPFSLVIGIAVREVVHVFGNPSGSAGFVQSYIIPLADTINNSSFSKNIGAGEIVNPESIKSSVSQIGQGAVSVLQKTYKGVAQFLLLSFVMFFTLYYILIGGRDVLDKIMHLSPLKDKHERLLIEKFISMSRATIKGTLVVAFVQGFIGGFVFAIVGVPSAVIWAIIMMVMSLIPVVGSSIIWFPAGVIMMLVGNFWEGISILAAGFFIISLVDNFLRPELVGKDTQMHPLLVFFATLGGIAYFGFLGFLIGPIIMALFLSLWDIYSIEFKKQLRNFNT